MIWVVVAMVCKQPTKIKEEELLTAITEHLYEIIEDKEQFIKMMNEEANRLISYLGISEYEYSDRLGSAFTVGNAKGLLDSASLSYDKVDIQLKYVPNFVPLTKNQFESLYSSMITALELDRLSSESLYIYNIDSANEQVIDGVVYEVVNTNNGDYYMEKDYGMDSSYIGKVAKVYVSNNEIILCEGESNSDVTIRNAYLKKYYPEII